MCNTDFYVGMDLSQFDICIIQILIKTPRIET